MHRQPYQCLLKIHGGGF
ncbi:hypothetical protein VCHC39A1_2140, partial [Vibrio cholerae HC-39A1]